MSAPLTLRAGALEVQLLPQLGGSIARFDRVAAGRRQPLLRAAPADANSVLDTGCFPMVPYVNRIRGGTFDCDGRTVTLTPNMAGDASPLHGQGWLGAWRTEQAGDDHATLSFHHAAGEWPWDYEATQHFRLDKDGLSLALSCRNLSADRMPCGLGFHPYYPCDADTMLDTEVESAWTIDAAVLPVDNVPATGHYDLRQRCICGQGLDNGFDGWSGTASITWPGEAAGLRLSSPDARRFQVYSPASGGLFVAEPVQQANAALNAPQADWPSLGMRLLEQGQSVAVHARFDVIVS
ncbi:aldose 1-epimerase [Sphingomonas sp.]|uniref:aldose 1-epimerase n=1 Tax=Sphingomonas sp. TaxID=28214 RepID=UPI002E3250F0|nr:aldose 1-epimerase [Sphingomonas sp.]HEX4694673.1 aldose 1-epimerase [Sphingomonas sp.]